MVKSRMTAIDICAMVHSIAKDLKGQKLINIYDINNRTYLLKFGGEGKLFLLIEAGIRFHTTHWKRGSQQTMNSSSVVSISYFNNKLRRYLRGKKLVDMVQMDLDRIVKLTFGFGENIFHLILEFFVAGNIILTDNNYNILVILRDNGNLSIGKRYNWGNGIEIDYSHVVSPLLRSPAPDIDVDQAPWIIQWLDESYLEDQLNIMIKEAEAESEKKQLQISGGSTNRRSKQGNDTIPSNQPSGITSQVLLGKILRFCHPIMLQQLLEKYGLDKDQLVTSSSIKDISKKFIGCIKDTKYLLGILCNSEVSGIMTLCLTSRDQMKEGDLVLRDLQQVETHVSSECKAKAEQDKTEPLYISFSPYVKDHEWIYSVQTLPKDGLIVNRFTSKFSDCVDEFYSSIDINKETKEIQQEEKAINSKIDKLRIDQERRLKELVEEKDACIKRANFMECCELLLEKILLLTRHLIATGAQWKDICNEVRQQRKIGHPIAKYIKSLDLEHDRVVVYFGADEFPEDFDYSQYGYGESNSKLKSQEGIEIYLNISKSMQANIRSEYEESKHISAKLERTKSAYKRALNKVTKTANRNTEKLTGPLNTGVNRIHKIRQSYWFEKFHWFISSDGFLVIGGNDSSQNELLYRRYLEKNDRYIHADIHGATTCIVKNPKNLADIPMNTLCEAGQMSICYSRSWANKTVISAWWVYPDQVSKTAPSGEYLTTGSFVIRGKKNFLPPLKLEMGIALVFIKNKKQAGKEELSDLEDINSKFEDSTHSETVMDTEIKVNLTSNISDKLHVNSDNDLNSTFNQPYNCPSESATSNRRSSNSTGVHVHFSAGDISDVIPPLEIPHRVQFDELPPELLPSKPFDPLSIDESTSNGNTTENIMENLYEILTSTVIKEDDDQIYGIDNNLSDGVKSSTDSSKCESTLRVHQQSSRFSLTPPRMSSRRSSVDEGPPPLGFSESTLPTPADLLSHRVKFPAASSSSEEMMDTMKVDPNVSDIVHSETKNLGSSLSMNSSDESLENSAIWLKNLDSSPSPSANRKVNCYFEGIDSHSEFYNKLRENYRRRSIDGGPTPRGFIPDHVPNARELLQKIRFDPIDLELENLAHMRERGRFISDAVPYLPEEFQRMIMISQQKTSKKHRFTVDTNFELDKKVDVKSFLEDINDERAHLNDLYSYKKNDKLQDINLNTSSESVNGKIELKIPNISSRGRSRELGNNQSTNQKLSRRKKFKLKKMALKYGEQDEQERKLRMVLTGSKDMKLTHSAKSPTVESKEPSSSIDIPKPLHITQQEKKKKEQERLERIYKERNVDNTIENREFENIREYLLKSNRVDIDPNIIAIIPICAPYSCVRDYEYIVKLTPGGNLKRSKAAQDIIHHFLHQSFKEKDYKPNSYEFIRILKVDDIIKRLMNPVKLHFSSEKRGQESSQSRAFN
ncbi:hypothetical protein cand_035800 [Cryptosporidium andersoni]|uniref:NFACT RNA-binding domain-containing protein n=1 Tax=Cryptosporidium andersoni TaxID=117008 RepID=A0A1J4MV64_9CRYT|nr:hypothetical protein cand_035800 [Cryptosporidium andersoni]